MRYDNVRNCPICGPVDVNGATRTILSDVDTEQNVCASKARGGSEACESYRRTGRVTPASAVTGSCPSA